MYIFSLKKIRITQIIFSICASGNIREELKEKEPILLKSFKVK